MKTYYIKLIRTCVNITYTRITNHVMYLFYSDAFNRFMFKSTVNYNTNKTKWQETKKFLLFIQYKLWQKVQKYKEKELQGKRLENKFSISANIVM